MKNFLLLLLAVCTLLSGCSLFQGPANPADSSLPDGSGGLSASSSVPVSGAEDNALPDSLLESYYLSSEDPAFSYLQHKSIQRFFDMWVENALDEDIEVQWNYDTLAPVQLLDHAFNSIAKPEDKLYTCTFSTEDGRYGYLVVSYHEEDPSISKWSLNETTPYQYDLRANSEQIAAALLKTDIDMSSAAAARVEWIDTESNRGDRVILFTDGKGGQYLCDLGSGDFSCQKQ